METEKQRLWRRVTEGVTVNIRVDDIRSQYELNAEDKSAPSILRQYTFSGTQTKISGSQNQKLPLALWDVTFVLDDKFKNDEIMMNKFDDSIVGIVNYFEPGDIVGECFEAIVPCSSEFFRSVEFVVERLVETNGQSFSLSLHLLGVPKDWKPMKSKPGKSTFDVSNVTLFWNRKLLQKTEIRSD